MHIANCTVAAGCTRRSPADMQAFAELVVKLGKFALTHSASIRSIDINPVLIRAQGLGVIAVDALVEFA